MIETENQGEAIRGLRSDLNASMQRIDDLHDLLASAFNASRQQSDATVCLVNAVNERVDSAIILMRQEASDRAMTAACNKLPPLWGDDGVVT